MQGVGQFTRLGMAAKSGGILTKCVESNRRVESMKIMSVAGALNQYCAFEVSDWKQ